MSEGAGDPTRKAAALRREFDASFAEARVAHRAEPIGLLAITVAGEPYGIELKEIAGMHADRMVVPLPEATPGLLGVAAVRGAPIPVYDLGALLGYVGHASGRRFRWLVQARGSSPVALAFDAFVGHLRAGERESVAVPAPSDAGGAGRAHVRAAVRSGEVVYPVLDLASLVETIARRGTRRRA